MKISICTLGCKVNQYESEVIYSLLTQKGYEVSYDLEYADAYILNTCAVTNLAERKSRQLVARCLSLNPNARILVIGCASENKKEQFLDKKNVTYISGVGNKYDVVDFLKEERFEVIEIPREYKKDLVAPTLMGTRAHLKIQDGCDNFCSYCLIPYVRGRSRSKELKDILEEINELSKRTREIVLTGINLSNYGKGIGLTLKDLILSIKGIESRIRLGSLEANIIDTDFLKALKSLKNFCPHFHLSLQSGSNSVLKQMNRKYTTETFLEKVNLIREYFPLASITTDIICGFPTETEKEFNETKEFVKKVKFSQVHIFPYSRRSGTVAAKFKPLKKEILNERTKELKEITQKLKKEYMQKFIGKEVEVLFEERKGAYKVGYSKEYIRVYQKANTLGEVQKIKIQKLFKDGLLGE